MLLAHVAGPSTTYDMEPIRGEVGLLSEGIWGGTGDARTGGGVGETPLEAVSTSFVSASFMDE